MDPDLPLRLSCLLLQPFQIIFKILCAVGLTGVILGVLYQSNTDKVLVVSILLLATGAIGLLIVQAVCT